MLRPVGRDRGEVERPTAGRGAGSTGADVVPFEHGAHLADRAEHLVGQIMATFDASAVCASNLEESRSTFNDDVPSVSHVRERDSSFSFDEIEPQRLELGRDLGEPRRLVFTSPSLGEPASRLGVAPNHPTSTV